MSEKKKGIKTAGESYEENEDEGEEAEGDEEVARHDFFLEEEGKKWEMEGAGDK